MADKDNALAELEDLKNQAEEQAFKLQELLTEADQ